MSNTPDPRRRAVVERDAALRRLRWVTRLSVVATVAVGAGFAALAAGSTQTKKLVRTPVRRPVTTAAPVLTQAPAPPLVAVQGASAPAPTQQAPTPAAPQSAPAPSYQPPVVVSGGS